jgi:hypothetical protein
VEQRAATADHRLLLQRNPHIRRIALQRFPKEPCRGNPGYRKGMPLDHESRADNRWVGAISGLPHTVAEHQHWRSRWGVILGRNHTTVERAHPHG